MTLERNWLGSLLSKITETNTFEAVTHLGATPQRRSSQKTRREVPIGISEALHVTAFQETIKREIFDCDEGERPVSEMARDRGD